MTVTVAGTVESLRTGTDNPHTWSHNVGTSAPKGVIVAIMKGVSDTDYISSVDYGGVALTRIQRNVDSSGEAGVAELWFAGSGIPTGSQTVTVNLTSGIGDDIHFVSVTLDAASDLTVGTAHNGTDNNKANPGINLYWGAPNGMAFAAFYSGLTTIGSITAGTDCTIMTSSELAGSWCSVLLRQTTAGTTNFYISASSATDDVAFAAMAVWEDGGWLINNINGSDIDALSKMSGVNAATIAKMNGVTIQ